jgi:hypothetical protein
LVALYDLAECQIVLRLYAPDERRFLGCSMVQFALGAGNLTGYGWKWECA